MPPFQEDLEREGVDAARHRVGGHHGRDPDARVDPEQRRRSRNGYVLLSLLVHPALAEALAEAAE